MTQPNNDPRKPNSASKPNRGAPQSNDKAKQPGLVNNAATPESMVKNFLMGLGVCVVAVAIAGYVIIDFQNIKSKFVGASTALSTSLKAPERETVPVENKPTESPAAEQPKAAPKSNRVRIE
jgi:hypothetical protein